MDRAAHECVLAVVGSVYDGATPETIAAVKAAIVEAFDRHDPRWVVSGGARGVDSWAQEEAGRRFTRVTVAHPKNEGTIPSTAVPPSGEASASSADRSAAVRSRTLDRTLGPRDPRGRNGP